VLLESGNHNRIYAKDSEMNVDIPAELTPFVQQMLSRGAYRNETEMLVDGLRLLRAKEQLRVDVDAGITQLEIGEGRDGDEVFTRLEQRARNYPA
jgi:putative addiction module CopG family antidote